MAIEHTVVITSSVIMSRATIFSLVRANLIPQHLIDG